MLRKKMMVMSEGREERTTLTHVQEHHHHRNPNPELFYELSMSWAGDTLHFLPPPIPLYSLCCHRPSFWGQASASSTHAPLLPSHQGPQCFLTEDLSRCLGGAQEAYPGPWGQKATYRRANGLFP